MIVKEGEDIEWKIVLQKKSHLLNLAIKHFKLRFYHLMLISDDLTKSYQPRGGGRVLKKVLYGEAPPRGPTPYPFIYHFFFRKGTPFVYLLLEKGTPFIYLQVSFRENSFIYHCHWPAL